jgi:hypothetical protein
MVFDQGDYGDKFYVILKGSVGVDISIKQKVEPEELELRKQKFETEKSSLISYIQKLQEYEQEFIQIKEEKGALRQEQLKLE